MQLRPDIDDRLPEYARIDGQRFRQCLSNLLSNAIKYAPQGSITLTVTAPSFGMIAVEMCDTGPGVPAALHERILEPFHRGESAERGTGLGLSISRTLARRMGGDLTLLPAASGARFYLTLATLPAAASEMPTAMPTELADLTGRLVLVVDVIPTNRLVAMTYLRIMGAEAVEAGTGEAALAFLTGRQPDFVVLDMLMPGMNGLETLRRLPGLAVAVPVILQAAVARTAECGGHGRAFLSLKATVTRRFWAGLSGTQDGTIG